VVPTGWSDVEAPATEREFVVERALVVDGRVVDAQGRPVAECSVDAEDADEGRDGHVEDVETDVQGRFRLLGVLPGRWKLEVRYDGVHPVVRDFVVEAGAKDVEIAADVGHLLRGRLVGPDGQPLAGRSAREVPIPVPDDAEVTFVRPAAGTR
jgi:hypothetical protein